MSPYNTGMNAPLLQPVFDESVGLPLAQACDADLFSDEAGPQLSPRRALAASASMLVQGAIAPIADLGLLRVHGVDAVAFLQGQLTNDVAGLATGRSMLAGYCSAKGRMLASMRVWRHEDSVWLMPTRVLAPGLLKRLSLFVLRSKVRIEDVSATSACFGLCGDAAVAAVHSLGVEWPAPGELRTVLGKIVLGIESARIADQTVRRAILIAPLTDAQAIWTALSSPLAPISSTTWRWTDVMSGVGRVLAPGVERFVPQMINFDLVDGVSFRKGCYPGQEVVARSHYLGKLKRRLFLASVTGEPPVAGLDVFEAGASEPCGQVVLSAPAPGGGAALLFESQIGSAPEARLADGRALQLLALPYTLPAA